MGIEELEIMIDSLVNFEKKISGNKSLNEEWYLSSCANIYQRMKTIFDDLTLKGEWLPSEKKGKWKGVLKDLKDIQKFVESEHKKCMNRTYENSKFVKL